MQISDGTNSIVDEIDSLCDSDSSSYPIADKIRRVNYNYERLIGDILGVDGTWDWDDTNHSDMPKGTFTLTDATAKYTFNSEYLEVKSIKVKNANGLWVPIRPIDEAEIPESITIEEYFADSGLPRFYDQLGDTIIMYPAPSSDAVTLTKGGKIEFSRKPDLFTTTDDTQSPGFPSPYHVILAYLAAIPYCMKYKQDRVGLYQQVADRMKAELLDFYARRNKAKRKKATMKQINFK